MFLHCRHLYLLAWCGGSNGGGDGGVRACVCAHVCVHSTTVTVVNVGNPCTTKQ